MNRLVAGRRLLGTLAVLALAAAPAVFLEPRPVRAFTLPVDVIYFDPISVPVDHTLHVHLVNQLSNIKMDFQAVLAPTTPGAGSPVFGPIITLAPGDGSDEAYPFAVWSPPAGLTRVPVVASIFVTLTGSGPLPADWSGNVASSVEIVSDKTELPTEILGGRHVIRADRSGNPVPCLFCN